MHIYTNLYQVISAVIVCITIVCLQCNEAPRWSNCTEVWEVTFWSHGMGSCENGFCYPTCMCKLKFWFLNFIMKQVYLQNYTFIWNTINCTFYRNFINLVLPLLNYLTKQCPMIKHYPGNCYEKLWQWKYKWKLSAIAQYINLLNYNILSCY